MKYFKIKSLKKGTMVDINQINNQNTPERKCKIIFIIFILLWKEPAFQTINLQSYKMLHTSVLLMFNPTKLLTISTSSYRKIGKKCTSNFLARYTYGNRMEKGLKNVHVNIRSLKYKIQEVKNIVQNNSPHILGLSEAELKKSTTDISALKIPGYDILFPKSWEVNGTARIILYVKKSLDYERVDNLENTSIQSIWIRGNFKHSKKMYFCHAYREHWDNLSLPNQRNKLDLFLSQWEAALEYDNPGGPNEVHVSLDMNLDSYQGKWLQPTYKYVSLARIVQNYCDIGNFTQLVKEPTRLMYNSVSKTIEKSCIDHIYTNAKSWCSNPTIIPFGELP